MGWGCLDCDYRASALMGPTHECKVPGVRPQIVMTDHELDVARKAVR